LERELITVCGEHLAGQKVPRSIDFEGELPRLRTGNLSKDVLRDSYWSDQASRILYFPGRTPGSSAQFCPPGLPGGVTHGPEWP
jgi:hypothetical protein